MTASARLAAFLVVVAAAGCGKGDAEKKSSTGDTRTDASGANFEPVDANGMPDMEKLAEEQKKAYAQMNGGKDIKAVDPEQMKTLLPAEYAGTQRKNAETTQVEQMGMNISTTKCNYEAPPSENDDGSNPKPSFRLEITDLGNVSGALGMGFTAWTTMTFNKTTDTGYEKMTKYKGMPCEERYDREAKDGEMKLYVAKRFVVDVHGNDCTIEQVKGLVDALDTSKLEALVK